MDTYYTDVLTTIEAMRTPEVVKLHNSFCDSTGMTHRAIFRTEDFNNFFPAYTPKELAETLAEAVDFNIRDDFFTFRGGGEPVSFSDWSDPRSGIDAEELADYITTR